MAAASRQLVPGRSQQTAAPAVPAKRGRLDNSAEFVVAKLDDLINWARKVSGGGGKRKKGKKKLAVCLPCPAGFPVANDVWPGLLCHRDDARSCRQIRHGPFRNCLQSQPRELLPSLIAVSKDTFFSQ